MGLLPLEFSDCLTDSPHFRENLRSHEAELERTSQAIKGIIKEVQNLFVAARNLSKAQRSLANSFVNFKLECIGNNKTDDEIVIADSLKEFGRLLNTIEDERDRMLENAHAQFIEPIEKFRKDHIGAAKVSRKKFEKDTTRYCQALERHLSLSAKKGDNTIKESDNQIVLERELFVKASLDYVLELQKVQERKKTEFVETILRFMYGLLTFYHQGHEVAKDFNSFNTDLQVRLQKTRENVDAIQSEAEELKSRMLQHKDPGCLNRMYARQGYLFLLEKKHLTSIWNKHYCMYQKETRKFTMIPFSQTGRVTSTDSFLLKECVRRTVDSIDRRFCFDLTPKDRSGTVYTFQALSVEDYKSWLNAMDGKEPHEATGNNHVGGPSRQNRLLQQREQCFLDKDGFDFVRDCIDAIEARGLEDQGLYRIVGVNSKVAKLAQLVFSESKRSGEKVNLMDPEWEVKTITSALKNYFRSLPEPVMTYRLHAAFIIAAKQEVKARRVSDVESLVRDLPPENFRMLKMLIEHLYRVTQMKDKNLMTVSNLGVCFGPTLLRPEEETVAAIMDIKFCNVVVEILIENHQRIFSKGPRPLGNNDTNQRASTIGQPMTNSGASPQRSVTANHVRAVPPPGSNGPHSQFYYPQAPPPPPSSNAVSVSEPIYGARYDMYIIISGHC